MRGDGIEVSCENLAVSYSEFYADLQPATERIGLTERLAIDSVRSSKHHARLVSAALQR